MARTLYLSDGSTEIVFGDERQFLERVLRERLGNDTAELFNEIIAEYETLLDEAKAEIENQKED